MFDQLSVYQERDQLVNVNKICFGFFEAVVFTSEDNCWVEGMCAKRTFPTLNNCPRYVNTTAKKTKKI